jgi:hypothetical protein
MTPYVRRLGINDTVQDHAKMTMDPMATTQRRRTRISCTVVVLFRTLECEVIYRYGFGRVAVLAIFGWASLGRWPGSLPLVAVVPISTGFAGKLT